LTKARCVQAIATMIDTRKLNYSCFGAMSCPSFSQSLADTFTELVVVENAEICCWTFDPMSYIYVYCDIAAQIEAGLEQYENVIKRT